MTRRVVLLTTVVKQYRRVFLGELAARLRRDDIALRIAYSEPNRIERVKSDNIELPPELGIKVPAVWLLGDRLFVQLAWRAIRDADLVIVEQANKHALNYPLLALSWLGRKRVAYWGHGYNRQERSPGVSEWLKRKLVTRVDWWFAYTDGVARYLADQGVDPRIITVVHNTIDTRELAEAVRAHGDAAARALRRRLGIADDARVGLFCGSLYADKRLDLLIDAIRRIRERRHDFELIIVGDGPAREAIRGIAAGLRFVHYVGPAFGRDRAAYFAISDVFLNPGVVGLAIVDAFAVGLPVFATDISGSGPEIEYLEPEVNGMITAHDAGAYAAAVCHVLDDLDQLARMRDAARATAARLSLANMVEAFADGIAQCLDARA
jgi:glycosyltransferase involved in cell wall biosynthesis